MVTISVQTKFIISALYQEYPTGWVEFNIVNNLC